MPQPGAKTSTTGPRRKRKASKPRSIQELKGILRSNRPRPVSIAEMNEVIAEGFAESVAIPTRRSRTAPSARSAARTAAVTR